MFEVICEKLDGTQRRYVVDRFARAKRIASKNVDRGYRVRVRRLREDIWISHPHTGDLVLVNSKMQVNEAIKQIRDATPSISENDSKYRPNRRDVPPGWGVVRTDW